MNDDKKPDKTPATDSGNGAHPADPQRSPSFRVAGQYVKDLSFENPNAPASFGASREGPPTMNVTVDVRARRLEADQYEVDLKISGSAKHGDTVIFIVEVVYAGIFVVQDIPEADLQPLLYIEAPRFIFPFARRVIGTATTDGGFPPLLIDPIDFAALYRHQQERNKKAAEEAAAPGPTAD